MKSYHKTCGSSDIVAIGERKGKIVEVCRHCAREIDSYEIQHTSDLISCVSKVTIAGKEIKYNFIDAIKSKIS